ncbi:polysaccharide biosynthesis protein [Streptomyces sp. NPDC002490]|uniref:polysaccharide biosynthesis protein n=1 Tax=Streptomyces sp. NPDC002490 TaxID=3154416 RepID=UPI0033226D58
MSEDTIRLVTIGRILRRRGRLLTVLALTGALVGYGASLVFPPRYTTSTSVLLQGQWEERELLTQVEIATSSTVVDRAAAALGWTGVGSAELRGRVGAQATDGTIIKISGTAETPERAQRLSDRVAQEFIAFATRLAGGGAEPEAATGPEALRQKVVETNRRITDLAEAADPGRTVESVQTRTTLEKLRSALDEAVKKLEEADPATGRSGMVVMGPAARPAEEAPPTRVQLVGAGAVSSFLLGVVGHLAAARSSRRLRTESEIAAALGSVLLGTVDVPVDRSASPAARDPRARLRHLLALDTRWDAPRPSPAGDESGSRIRYQRVCARLRDERPGSHELLVVVPEGDETAHRAAERLVVEARNAPPPPASGGGRPALRVVRVSVSRPMVPDRDDTAAGALVVLSAHRWTAEELAGVAGACTDGGYELLGTVVAGTALTRPAGSADPASKDDAPAPGDRGQATGEPA